MKEGNVSVKNFLDSVQRSKILDSLGECISIQDREFRILYQNLAHQHMFGECTGELCFRRLARLDTACDDCPLVTLFKKTNGAVHRIQKLYTLKGISCFSVMVSPLKNGNSRIQAGIFALRDITAQNEEYERLKDKEERYRTIFNDMTVASFLIDPGTLRIVDTNRKALELSGYSAKALSNMTMLDLHPREEQDIAERIFQKAAGAGMLAGVCGINHCGKDGSCVSVELDLAKLKLQGKEFILCTARDISKKKNAEETLRHDYERMVNILDSVDDGIYMVNRQYEIQYINTRIKTDFGQVRGRKCHDYFTGSRQPCPWCTSRRVFEGKKQRREWKSSITHRTYDIIDMPLNDPDGGSSMLSILRDVTERKRIEEVLRESEDRFRTMFRSSPVGIAMTGPDGSFIEVNPAFTKMLGYSGDEVLKNFIYLTHPDDTVESMNFLNEMKEGKRDHCQFEKRYFRRDGSTMWVNLSATALKDSSGQFKYALSVIEDITNQKMIEERLQEAAITDALTGLFNRRGFFALADQQMKQANRSRKWLSLFYMDLDGLKTINDELGHTAGDQALIDTAAILKKTFRESDIIARIGGDEFVALITALPKPDTAEIVTKHVHSNFDDHNRKTGKKYELLISTGVVFFDPDHPCSVDDLLSRADALMYDDKKKHKEQRRNRTVKSEKRRHRRFMPGSDCWAAIDNAVMLRIRDLSAGGICVRTTYSLPLHSVHELKLLPTLNGQLAPKAMVIWSSPHIEAERGNIYMSGLRFLDMDQKTRNNLSRFIRTFVRERQTGR